MFHSVKTDKGIMFHSVKTDKGIIFHSVKTDKGTMFHTVKTDKFIMFHSVLHMVMKKVTYLKKEVTIIKAFWSKAAIVLSRRLNFINLKDFLLGNFLTLFWLNFFLNSSRIIIEYFGYSSLLHCTLSNFGLNSSCYKVKVRVRA